MKLLQITYTGTTHYMRSVPLTGETEEVHHKVETKSAIVLIETDAPFFVESALIQFDHEKSSNDKNYKRTGHEIIGKVHAIYRRPVHSISKL